MDARGSFETLCVPSREFEGEAGNPAKAKEETMTDEKYAPGWNEARVRRVLEYYESQSDEEAAAEIDAAFKGTAHTTMEVPVALVPIVRTLIAERKPAAHPKKTHNKTFPAAKPRTTVTRI